MIRGYIIWRNNHAYDQQLRRIVDRASHGDALARLLKVLSMSLGFGLLAVSAVMLMAGADRLLPGARESLG
jgi:hypothetical protein